MLIAPLPICYLLYSLDIVVIAERVCLIVADIIVIVVTVLHTYGTVRASREAEMPTTLSSTLLRAGQASFAYSDHSHIHPCMRSQHEAWYRQSMIIRIAHCFSLTYSILYREEGEKNV